MQLLSDGIAVFGSRFGLAIHPGQNSSYLIRFSEHPGLRCAIKAGVVVDGQRYSFPLSEDVTPFPFMEQSSTFTSIHVRGTVPNYGLQIGFTIQIPFCPGDFELSTIPALLIDISVERMQGDFRWTKQSSEDVVKGSLFFSIDVEGSSAEILGDNKVLLSYIINEPYPSDSGEYASDNRPAYYKRRAVEDLLSGIGCIYQDGFFTRDFSLKRGETDEGLSIIYATYDEPVMSVQDNLCPFWYASSFNSVHDVVSYVKRSYRTLKKASSDFDKVCNGHTLGKAFDHLSVYAFHSWLINTFLVRKKDGSAWYTVWEGNCYFTSTVDVEYSQSPFYLQFWPELLKLQLIQWCDYIQVPDPSSTLKGVFLSHDTGQFLTCKHQYYPHHMEVEENCNFLLMAFSYWKKTNDQSLCTKIEPILFKMMDYLVSTDLKQTGIPATGCSNTIDDASPAIQYGNQQIYLGIKTYCAMFAGCKMIEKVKDEYTSFMRRALHTITTKGWMGDHFAVNCDRDAEGLTDPWTGQALKGTLEGWDAYHIFSTNGLVLLDMVGEQTDIPYQMLCMDLISSNAKTITEYGCRHTSYQSSAHHIMQEGLAGSSATVGWLSMNMLRDAAALFRNVDVTHQLQNYWDWICTVNATDIHLFFETFSGNNLCFYPRGLAIFALYTADMQKRQQN